MKLSVLDSVIDGLRGQADDQDEVDAAIAAHNKAQSYITKIEDNALYGNSNDGGLDNLKV